MWFRKSTDPLGKLLWEKHRMHVLPRPRRDVSVFQVFAVRDNKTAMSGDIDSLLRLEMPRPKVTKNEPMADVDGTASEQIDGSAGLNFLQGFLVLVGAPVAGDVSAAVQKSGNRSVRFQFAGCTRDHVTDDHDFAWKLSDLKIDRARTGMKDGYDYYVVTAVHKCSALEFEVHEKNAGKVDLAAEVPAIAKGEGGISVDKERRIRARSDKPVVYGVELNQLVYDEKRRRFDLAEARNRIHTRAVPEALGRAMIGGENDSMVIDLEE